MDLHTDSPGTRQGRVGLRVVDGTAIVDEQLDAPILDEDPVVVPPYRIENLRDHRGIGLSQHDVPPRFIV
jgi:hypothetical protein